ncbi:hypothetical protein GS597_03550 [Synechococcales cyanobacterium C]|uniref:Tubulin like n=1 Tax=Petrachloros mirabilis ULC683 TaxID=2781853 RepID=A0A8K1ZWW0_9CYAN|nr:tubulin-like doman-containing protein [Petrachloros mirabilis]NCJ05596.1 hypothetical protein [Petrachloros mirabilis ULC683]
MSESKHESRTIKRTLCIGLGGTGRDVLMQIRKLIIDQHGKLSNLPIVSFVHIDTDRGAGGISGLKTGNTYRGENILFHESEKVTASMTSHEIDDLIKGLKEKEIYGHHNPYNYIRNWLSPHLLDSISAIEDGASGIRPIGRLAFFYNYGKIQEAIQTAENNTINHEEFLINQGLIVEPGLNIFVVGSLCGGTGSGMFLDVAYALRKKYFNNTQLKGYLIISPELYGDAPSMYANVYAALKELNHYSANNFRACYDPENIVQIDEQRAPFDFAYIISNKNSEDYKILDKNKLNNVIANKIYLDFGHELTPRIKEQESDFLLQMTLLDRHPRRNIQKYSTFGLAKIYFPNERIIQAALNQIKHNLIQFWIKGDSQSPDSKMLLDKFLLKWEVGQGNKAPFMQQLKSMSPEKSKTFSQSLKIWSSQIEASINSLQKSNDRQQFLDQIFSDISLQFRKVQPGETESKRGAWLNHVQESRYELVHERKKDIEEFLIELLQPSSQYFSLECANLWLEALKTQLNVWTRELEEDLKSVEGLSDLDDIDKIRKNASQRLEDIENQFDFLGFKRKKKNRQFQEESLKYLKSSIKLIRQNFDYVTVKESLHVLKELQQTVQELISHCQNFKSFLENMSVNHENQHDNLLHLNQDEITGEALFTKGDTEACYKIFISDKDHENILVEVSKQIIEQVSIHRSLFYLLVQENNLDEHTLRNGIDSICDKQFGHKIDSVQQSAIQRFMEKYPFAKAEQRMNQVLREAEPLLPLNLGDHYFENHKRKEMKIIAFKQSNNPLDQHFQNLLTQNLGINKSILKPIQSGNEVFIVNEYAAFPLRLINGLEKMRMHYDRQCHLDISLIHNNFTEIFTEIIPPAPKVIEKIQNGFYACLAFGKLDKTSEGYLYPIYDDFFNRHENIILEPTWTAALEQISKNATLAEELFQAKQDVIEEIRRDNSRWEHHYEPKLQEFINYVEELPETDPNYKERVTVIGERATLEKPKRPGILTKISDYIKQEVLGSKLIAPTDKHLLEANSQKSTEEIDS